MVTKHSRQQAILRLVGEESVRTQSGVVRHLSKKGIDVNQSTVSRDIRDLGLVKAPLADGSYGYALPTNVVAMAERSIRILREFVEAVDGSGYLAVVHTGSGNAHPVAEAIDRLRLVNVVGTVAGDNTLLVILSEGTPWPEFRDEIEELIG